MIGIYKIENLINGRIYIGQSKNIKRRWRDHKFYIKSEEYKERKKKPPLYLDMELYGLENFSFSILKQCRIQDLNKLEKEYIKLYNSYIKWDGSNGYNLTRGGSFLKEKEKTETNNLIIRLWENGKSINTIHNIIHLSCDTIRVIIETNCPDYTYEESLKRGIAQSERLSKKPINRYNLFGDLIGKYSSINEAANKFGYNFDSLSLCANQKQITAYRSYWIFSEDNQEEVLISKMKSAGKFAAVKQYDLKGNYIRSFETIADAKKINNISSSAISKSAKNIGYTAGGYFWQYVYDKTPICTVRRESGYSKRSVDQYDLNGKYIKTFESIHAACDAVGLKSISSIRGCCLHEKNRKSAGGFQWKFSDDEGIIIKPYKKRNNYKTARSIPVKKFSLDGELLEIFDYIKDAALSIGVKSTNKIKECCEGKIYSYKGFRWEYI